MNARKLILWIAGILLSLPVLLVVLALAAGPTPLRTIVRTLPLGWFYFLQRNVREVTVNVNLIVTGVLCSLFLILVGHLLLKAMFRQLSGQNWDGQTSCFWHFRWTIFFYLGLWLLFAICIATSGLDRQITWWYEDKEPWFEQRTGSGLEMSLADFEIDQLISDTDGDLAALESSLHTQANFYRRGLIPEDYDILLFGDKSNKVTCYVIVPRKQPTGGRGTCLIVHCGEQRSRTYKPLSELREAVTGLDSEYPRPQ